MEGHGLSAGACARPLFLTIAVTMWSLSVAGYCFHRVAERGGDPCAILSVYS
jgi:hypothetical protein